LIFSRNVDVAVDVGRGKVCCKELVTCRYRPS